MGEEFPKANELVCAVLGTKNTVGVRFKNNTSLLCMNGSRGSRVIPKRYAKGHRYLKTV